jgi:Cu(I)/Ag(I) efflux system membrane fusion protein
MKSIFGALMAIAFILSGCKPDVDQQPERKVLYYRNPMGLQDTSPTPKKDAMGMDYVPVYADEPMKAASGSVVIGPEKVQRLGVRTAPVEARQITKQVEMPATLQVDPARIATIAPRFGGYVEKLLVSAAGEPVHKGQPLTTLYSPDLSQAQAEYQIARQAGSEASGMLSGSAAGRLRNMELPSGRLALLNKGGAIPRTIDWPSPLDGVVVAISATPGQPFTTGQTLYQLADLSHLWAVGKVAEQDLPALAVGQQATLKIAGMTEPVTGTVSLVGAVVDTNTRTADVRVVVPNPEGKLRAGMFASLEVEAPVSEPDVLTVPESAVLDDGKKQVVLIADGQGTFTPRPVQVGARGSGYVEIVDGVFAGESVVVQANFLIDAESSLKAALQSIGTPSSTQPLTEQHQH